MGRYSSLLLIASLMVLSACSPTVNVEQERNSLMAADQAASAATGDLDKFLSVYDSEATVYPPGMPKVSGAAAVKGLFTQLMAPGTTVHWTPGKAVVAASGDIGYTTGAYTLTADGTTETGKYVSQWKKTNGQWKMVEDIFNADTGMAAAAPSTHAVLTPADVKWGDAPPTLLPGAKVAVLSGDPTKPGQFVMRLQMPAGYRIAAHWHPTDEVVTVVSGNFAVGMGDKLDDKAAKTLPAGSFVLLPAKMHHYALTKSPVVVQVNAAGPFAINYIDPADDPSKKAAK